MKWGDNARDFDTALAVWPNYRPLFGNWLMQELVEQGDKAPIWRDRRVPTENGHVRGDIYPDREAAMSAAASLNPMLHDALAGREMDGAKKISLQLKVAKNLQARQRLHEEEELMLAEARRRHANDPRPVSSSLVLPPESEPFRQELTEQLSDMPYLRVVMVGQPARRWRRSILYRSQNNVWSKPYTAGIRSAEVAMRARIANGFDSSADAHWGKTKAKIRQILLPRANQLLQLASVQRMLAEALANGQKVLVSNGIVFWYEEDGGIGWQVKHTTSTKESEGSTLWKEGTIRSINHGRLVILPYIKESGEHVRGHTRNGPNDGRAKPRHPDHYLDIPFSQLDGDLMIGLFGELPYE
ncbi:hypothetical protein [Pseudorhodoplanes sinuspersici]|uniref:Uncharacterized protein n=1 Tax=Pseudorhodoplanes sinuspersici TaxID=1235591 RepID=A0A1W7A0V7_9HYPH|nr:hypothetical protein [Pseudorhodoplanes sinuspersici]ARQ02655.1 hypothetical protein CAK95_28805 [Pseudorhodoplanes sinuspersici]RKE74528.1 hypothetical protein DFP91_2445 [Pseudorhodoplanes sinuspersici]